MRRLALLVLPLALSGCFYPANRGKALESRLDRLDTAQAQVQEELKRTRAELDATLPRIDEKIAEVSKALQGLDTASRRSGADIGIQLQKTVEDLAQLRGQVETYVYKIGELESALSRTSDDTNQRFLALKGEEAQKEAEARKKAEELKRPTDKKEFLALAQSKAKGGEVPVARQLYNEFIKKWPKDALTADAHFGLGESYFAEDKCREALFEYGKLLQEYPKSESTPNAYLRSSECFKKLKMQEESRLALEELVKGYPKSDAAKTAKSRLAELDKAKKGRK
ncbi:tetratricopeptide repeat protein [Archangium primigenium]|uniref:tetratricopeptide repeat protein n=1 Tax=[Archangium] primigenium TaxID=2792470 RepID=UPI00195AA9CF|nr:tetratricopeptide repeat protein [Archangium primigenium]MBM7117920.1 tetratricopeptide repeat protein [Archangium primigenium]